MRPEAEAWLRQSRAERRSADVALEGGGFFLVAFLAHQAAEKALKAAAIELLRQPPPRTHDLTELARVLDVPAVVAAATRRLNPHYAVSRYPDAANGVPAEQYDGTIARELLDACEEVMAWVDSALTTGR